MVALALLDTAAIEPPRRRGRAVAPRCVCGHTQYYHDHTPWWGLEEGETWQDHGSNCGYGRRCTVTKGIVGGCECNRFTDAAEAAKYAAAMQHDNRAPR